MSDNGFKTKVFGGFNKKQVLSYLDDVHAEFNEKSNELQKEIDELNKQCDALKDDCNQLTEAVNNKDEKNKNLEKKMAILLEEKNTVEENLKQKESEISVCKEQVRRAVFEMESMKVKCEKYDKIHDEINDLMSEANNMADKIKRDAKLEAEAIIKEANEKADNITKEAKADTKTLSSNLVAVNDDIKSIKTGLVDITNQVEEKVKEIEALLAKNLDRMGIDASEIDKKPQEKPTVATRFF